MDNDFKWLMIFLMVVGSVGSIGLTINEIQKTDKSIQAIKAGLEECPNLNSNVSNDTIFVKSCKEFTEEYHKNKEE